MSAERTVVLGVGNELYRDDGVGVVVARELAAGELPAGVTVIEGRVGGLDLLFDMEGTEYVIIVDAVDMRRSPGSILVFTPDDVAMMGLGSVASLHEIGLEHVLELGPLVGVTPRLHIVGIQPGEVAPGFELTEPVAEAVPGAVAAVRRLLAGEAPDRPQDQTGEAGP